jgi:hypothetical protein
MPLLEDWLATSSTSKAVVLAVVVGISRCATILALVIPGSRAMWLHLSGHSHRHLLTTPRFGKPQYGLESSKR